MIREEIKPYEILMSNEERCHQLMPLNSFKILLKKKKISKP